jgi:hypothetical protein
MKVNMFYYLWFSFFITVVWGTLWYLQKFLQDIIAEFTTFAIIFLQMRSSDLHTLWTKNIFHLVCEAFTFLHLRSSSDFLMLLLSHNCFIAMEKTWKYIFYIVVITLFSIVVFQYIIILIFVFNETLNTLKIWQLFYTKFFLIRTFP